MNILLSILSLLGLSAQQPGASAPAPPPALGQFAFVVGRWTSEGETFPESYGAAAGKFSGEVECRWGPQNLWIETDSAAALASGPRYTVHILVAAKPGGVELTALAVNSASAAGVTYEGRVEGPAAAVFTGHAAKKWQRVAYRRVANGDVEFSVEESSSPDGPWLRHSRAHWTPRH